MNPARLSHVGGRNSCRPVVCGRDAVMVLQRVSKAGQPSPKQLGAFADAKECERVSHHLQDLGTLLPFPVLAICITAWQELHGPSDPNPKSRAR